jgi:fucose permease
VGLLLLGYLAFVLIGLPDGLVGVAWPSVSRAFGLPDTALGLVIAAMAAGHFCAGLVSGRLFERLGAGRMLAAAALAAACGAAAQAAAPVWPAMVGGGALAGLGTGGIDAAMNTYVAGRWSPRQINWLHGCYGAGATIGPFLMTAALASGRSWRVAYLVCAAGMALSSGAFAATRGRWIVAAGRGGRGGASWRQALRHRLVPVLLLIFFCYTGLEVTLGQWSFTVLTEARGWSAADAALWTSIYWGSLTAGRFGLGALVGRVGPTRMIRLCMVATAAGSLLFAMGFPRPGLVLAGAGLAPIFPTLMSRMPQRLGASVALHAVGFMVSAAMVGSGALPSLAGAVAARAGLEAVGWVAVATAFVMLALHEGLLRIRKVGALPQTPLGPEAPDPHS